MFTAEDIAEMIVEHKKAYWRARGSFMILDFQVYMDPEMMACAKHIYEKIMEKHPVLAFYDEVEKETEQARDMFLPSNCHLDRDLPDRSLWMTVIMEEIGKLSRVCNKLAIMEDPDTRWAWMKEGVRRMITTSSLIRRFYERWDALEKK